ncbi:tRNA pseudouridine(38-40) synthase [Enterococcus moraviensis ATCC BAA-383]|uniref:tRNA pseudouridine synthase A n=1 Tax=Enterococcus moraviensis ATCC BAA-383 TaxID=1158609 RepID=R2RD77_9ENTE|nr:tRNA pseudouridine(38-40) synthase TruA [Enterococcus moraviensis]EOI06955.1 tRNA pseudouridine(38-40) synthase [Enterococcus moraviensis ATCC BAA-383]EOT65297.1 tRNA pseudouridine(38-40) synthase [Enterococcus moraviensis ATCC BAA-383]OJG66815.1 tRNA pseudouridine(38-40) synthase [Enterococcus moraviensis]
MRNIKLTIEYDGTRYLGWQRLGDSDKTIQGKIENILTQMTRTKIEIIGSGRTDAGTHARGQIANFKTESKIVLPEMIEFLNRYLPQDIVVKKAEEVPERFHARYNAKGKQYSYFIWNDVIPSAFERNYSFHYSETLNFELMNEACRKLTGTHDFIGFSSLKKTKKSTTRTIDKLSIRKEGNLIHFTFVGDGFLHKMVRILMGTLLEIGSGTLPLDVIDEVFESKIRSEAGMTLPAQGLFLDEVYY